jgi:PhnB protein
MATTLNPYLNFDGTTREAMEFYRDVFGGELSIMTFGDMGTEGPQADGVMHSSLTAEGLTLMASDMPPGQALEAGNNFGVSLSGDDEGELMGYWDKLSADGTVTVPMEKQMWGDSFGMCIDRFGTPWLVNIAGTPAS